VRELRHFPEGVFKPVPADLGSFGRKVNGVFEQRGGMGFESAALSGGLSSEFGLNFGPYVNGDRHALPLSRYESFSSHATGFVSLSQDYSPT
jgi:hypothetical protein